MITIDNPRLGDTAAGALITLASPLSANHVGLPSKNACMATYASRGGFPDIHHVALAALPSSERLCRLWLPDGRRVGRWWICAGLDGKFRDGCRVNLDTGRWEDVKTGWSGTDLVDLAAAIFDIERDRAALKIQEVLNDGLQSMEAA